MEEIEINMIRFLRQWMKTFYDDTSVIIVEMILERGSIIYK
jgi:hypothetical protein